MRYARLSVLCLGSSLSSAAVGQSERPTDAPALPGLEAIRRSDCASTNPDGDIVVCRKRGDRFRIPKDLRTGPRASASIKPHMPLTAGDFAPCGIFQGERQCGRNEAAQYGYGQGRDPVTAALKIIDSLRGDKK